MAEVTFPVEFGGDGKTYTDDADQDTGLDDVGYQTRFVPALAGSVAMAAYAKNRAAAAEEFAETCQQLREDVVARQNDVREKQQAAAGSANSAKTSETNAGDSAAAAKGSETAAASSAAKAKTSETNASGSAGAAKTSETNAGNSATAAKGSEMAAASSATKAKTSETNASGSASAAKSSETKAGQSATQAKGSETAAAGSASDAQQAAAQMNADDIMHRKGSGLPNEVGTAAKRDVGTDSGNVMEVGAFGVGSTLSQEVQGDINSGSDRGGFYSFTPTNPNGGFVRYGGSFIHVPRAGRSSRLHFDYGASRLFHQHQGTDGSWGGPVAVVDARTIVGSLGDGLPAVIERGENSNGLYTKYADGLLVCFKAKGELNYLNSSTIRADWTFPHSFVGGQRVVTATYTGTSGIGAPTSNYRQGTPYEPDNSNTGSNIGFITNANFSNLGPAYANLLAVGYWK
ncbi:hypothetical protein [Salinicola halophyticus]|uniref:hypothetical protein n=1 Tax=Salinicola halophyticus TaxID=1808881 RepID=UPI000DA1E416|nr:hypothetical protein [Salinicola halophyticus]